MKKVSELTGAELDYFVAKAEGVPVALEGAECWHESAPDRKVDGADFYLPSSDWSIGGPIIDRERIGVCENPNTPGEWIAAPGSMTTDEIIEGMHYGPTPLIAAMRVYVASKFGNEVPDFEK